MKSRNKRKKLTKKVLELLGKKFDEFYSSQNNLDHNGPKLTIR